MLLNFYHNNLIFIIYLIYQYFIVFSLLKLYIQIQKKNIYTSLNFNIQIKNTILIERKKKKKNIYTSLNFNNQIKNTNLDFVCLRQTFSSPLFILFQIFLIFLLITSFYTFQNFLIFLFPKYFKIFCFHKLSVREHMIDFS
jgi:hypothetical protein